MKTWKLLAGLLILLATMSLAQAPERPAVELVPFVPSNKVAPEIKLEASFDSISSRVDYTYTLSNGAAAEQRIKTWTVIHDGVSRTNKSPTRWIEVRSGQATNLFRKSAFGWVPHSKDLLIDPGQSVTGFGCTSTSLPGVAPAYVTGFVPLLNTRQNYVDPDVVLPPEKNNLQIFTVSPMVATLDDPSPSELASRIESHWQEAEHLGWLPLATVSAQNLQDLLDALGTEDTARAVQLAGSLLQQLNDEEPGSHGLALVKPTLGYIIARWDRPVGSLTLAIAVLSKHVMPHKNEQVEVTVTPSIRADLAFSLYRVAERKLPNSLGEKVYSHKVTGVTADYQFTWDGQTDDGTPAHNGNYELAIEADDGFGNGETKSVSVQVNRQGKNALLLDNWTLLARACSSTALGYLAPFINSGLHLFAWNERRELGERALALAVD